ncbi:MAG TPA: MAPEG family protein [Steroidobacteraceae bacterium]|nr:MAPEG family protein [Steroidobacteraceae bacterium]
MPYVAIVTVVALLQFLWFGVEVGRARARYNIAAPAITGNEIFERHFRVHMNTLEQLALFLPVLWIFASFVSPIWAAVLGAVYVIGRFVYARSYVRDPKSRSIGFGLSMLPNLLMLIGIAIWAVWALVKSPGG